MKPIGYEDCLSEYKACLYDPINGEVVGWGYELLCWIDEDRFNELRNKTDMVYGYTGEFTMENTTWRVIIARLSHQEAIEKYGEFGVKILEYRILATYGGKLFGARLHGAPKDIGAKI